jgi:hypothetical protein
VAKNKKPDVFEINAKKKRVRACAEKSLELATKNGKVDAVRGARKEVVPCAFSLDC